MSSVRSPGRSLRSSSGRGSRWPGRPICARATIFLAAFILPFGLLGVGFARLPWRGRWLTWLWAALVGTALAYA